MTLNAIKRHASIWHNGSWERNKWFPGRARIACSNGCGKSFTKGYTMNRHAKIECHLSTVDPEERKRKIEERRKLVQANKKYRDNYMDRIVKYTGSADMGEIRDVEQSDPKDKN